MEKRISPTLKSKRFLQLGVWGSNSSNLPRNSAAAARAALPFRPACSLLDVPALENISPGAHEAGQNLNDTLKLNINLTNAFFPFIK